MPVTDLPVALTCFAGYVVQLVANIWLMPGPEMFNPAATKYLGHWCYLTYQTNLLSTLYFGASVVACVAPSAELDTALMALYPLFFTLGVFLTTAYYALDHTNPTNVRIKSSLQRQGWRWIWVSSHVEHALSLPIAILYACSIRMPLLLSSADELELVRSCRYACLLMYIAAYFALTLGNKLATGLWIYPVFNDAEALGGRIGVFLLMSAVAIVALAIATLGIHLVDRRN